MAMAIPRTWSISIKLYTCDAHGVRRKSPGGVFPQRWKSSEQGRPALTEQDPELDSGCPSCHRSTSLRSFFSMKSYTTLIHTARQRGTKVLRKHHSSNHEELTMPSTLATGLKSTACFEASQEAEATTSCCHL